MASTAVLPDIQGMYTYKRYTTGVRDSGTRYGEMVPAEPFPGAGALRDLSGASCTETPRILARYAALRAWSLQEEGAAVTVVRNARSAARAHLASAADGWPEAARWMSVLGAGRRAARGAGRSAALAALDAAADHAAEHGHDHGARAIREAVHRARWWPGESPVDPPSTS